MTTFLRHALVLFALASFAHADPLFTYAGDGLVVRVLTFAEDAGTIAGELVLDGQTLPFTGAYADDGVTVRGTFTRAGRPVAFTAVEDAAAGTFDFRAAGKRYLVREADAAPAADAGNPLAGGPDANDGNPLAAPARPAGDRPAQIKLRRVELPDPTMGRAAYTVLVPDGWRAEGGIQWSDEKTSYPQLHATLTAPDGRRVYWRPKIVFYGSVPSAAAVQQGGFVNQTIGTLPPDDVAQWVVDTIRASNREVSDVQLVSARRDADAERAAADQARQLGTAQGNLYEKHRLVLSYAREGVPCTEELGLTLIRSPDAPSQWMTTRSALLFIELGVSGPAATFERDKAGSYAVAATMQSTPGWFTQSQLLIMEQTQRNHQIGMAEIRRRGQMYDQVSDDQLAAWRRSNASGDRQQEARVDAIYERSPYRDVDGGEVKLPIHYENFYSNGKGEYLGTNGAVEPGGEWRRLEPVR